MWPMFKKEVWGHKVQLLAYCAIALALLWLYVALFPSIKASSAQFDKLLQAYPKALKQAMGLEELSFNTIEKFLAVEMFSFMWPIIAILYSVSRAGGMIAGEIEKGTMGLYLSLPVTRSRIFLAKNLGGVVSITALVLITILGIIPLTAAYSTSVSYSAIFKLAGLSLLFAWAVFAATLFVSTIFSERSKVYITAGGVLLLMYAANVVASLKPSLSWIHRISIFYYYNAQEVLSKGGPIRASSLLMLAGIIVVFTVAGVIVFSRRDIVN
jgi:ABC-2 type transport system permease protein